MASAFSHALMAITIGKTYSKKESTIKFFLLGCFCAVIPDADVLTFKLGISYDDFLGHRGFFHSFVFCLILSLIIIFVFYKSIKIFSAKGLLLLSFFFLCGSSHALLDMLTDGGRGVAIFAPFDNTRYFFPWRPIKVSPLSVSRFFSEYGWKVIKSEMIWIGIPCAIYMLALASIKKFRQKLN